MADSKSELPLIVRMIREGQQLTGLQAAAGKLWLDYGGAASDLDGTLKASIDRYWKAQPGADPYWDFLSHRSTCDSCVETNKYENLSICPNCFKTYCYRHNGVCDCGHKPLG